MELIKDSHPKGPRGAVLSIGNFDGLHLGHMKILRRLARRARELSAPSIVYTFDPHPRKVITPGESPPLIVAPADKVRLIEEAGVDCLVLASFTQEFASKHPREFVKDVLVDALGVKEVVVGHDYAFGKGKSGTIEQLKKFGREFGFGVEIVPAYLKGGSAVSSSRIRTLVTEGRVGEAAKLLGRDFSIRGTVVSGKDLGKQIGFPTANLKVSSELIPKNGVYAVTVDFDGRVLSGVMNVGLAPTFGGKKVGLEVHLLDFDGDIYGRELVVSLVRRLRGERPFRDIDALAKRIGIDIKSARRILAKRCKG
jgi:riboflavin kinase/FMN adenylyltransferase